jgi:thiosulfate dehydrogenase [quinone] large subunit
LQVLFEKPPKVLSRGIIVMLRVYLGVVMLVSGVNKVTATPPWTPQRQIEAALQGRAHAFYKPFLQHTVLPRVDFFGALIRWGEVLIGIALISGTLTRLACAAATLMLLNYMLMKGALPWQSGNDFAFTMIALAVLIGAGGRTLGIDARLARKWPKGFLW